MTEDPATLSMVARSAVVKRDWKTVLACAEAIIAQDPRSAEGFFLLGMVERVERRTDGAIVAFKQALSLDTNRYDAAVELANQYSMKRLNGEAASLLDKYTGLLHNSPRYLDLAGTVYTDIGLSTKAWPLFKRANELQPGLDLFESNMATCAVFLGKIEEARQLYLGLLARFPQHRKNHYQLSRLQKAKDSEHIKQMKHILRTSNEPDGRNIPLFFAIAKELEDLQQWQESFSYYQKACDAVAKVANYDVQEDIRVHNKIIEVCNQSWLQSASPATDSNGSGKSPIFIVGLPRTGTTLVERIISSHSQVASLGETLFLQMEIRKLSGVADTEKITPELIEAVAQKDMRMLAAGYLAAVNYRLGNEPRFIEKLPFNFLYAGFIAKAWPDAKIVHMVRNPMDACFSMFKQVFTWAYKFSYSLEDMGRYYVAYDQLRQHWRNILADRFIEVEYESLVADQELQTRQLLSRLDLEFEEQCLHFEKNEAPSATASSVQVRGKVHTDSVLRWRRFEKQLQPLKDYLESNGIRVG